MTSDDIIQDVDAIFRKKWTTRDGRVVPEAEDVGLGNDGITLTGTVLYADMADSTNLVNEYKPWFAAELYKAFLLGACRVIRNHGGEVTAFDGDRVMAVFLGDYKNSSAVKAALQINYLVSRMNKAIRLAYSTTAYTLSHTVGIDVSDLFIARTGIRASNDLVWVGRAANYAAKLSALGEPGFPTYITAEVFGKLSKETKYGGEDGKPMWEKRTWTERQVTVYRSNWYWKF
jgi:class 3 adenylate cyclase